MYESTRLRFLLRREFRLNTTTPCVSSMAGILPFTHVINQRRVALLYDSESRTFNLSALRFPVLPGSGIPQVRSQSEASRFLNRTLPFGGGTISTLKKFFGRAPPPSSFKV